MGVDVRYERIPFADHHDGDANERRRCDTERHKQKRRMNRPTIIGMLCVICTSTSHTHRSQPSPPEGEGGAIERREIVPGEG